MRRKKQTLVERLDLYTMHARLLNDGRLFTLSRFDAKAILWAQDLCSSRRGDH